MKTLLVMSTPGDKSIPQTKWQQPLGVSYIAACVRDISDVSIIDCNLEENYEKILLKEVNTKDQLIVGFSTNSYSYSEALRLAEIVKKFNPNAHITFGGYHATPLATKVLMNRGFVDSVVRGDGEIPFRELITSLSSGNDLSGVGSLTYWRDGHIISNPNAPLPELDSLPYPARDLLQLDKCLSNFKESLFHKLYNISRIFYVSATRGCPHRCNFCSIFNKEWRTRNPLKIVDEFEYLIEDYEADSIYLVGDNINLKRKWILDLCDNIIRRDMDIKWICATLNPMMIDDEIISKMHDSGCVRATFGFESGSQEMLDSMNKGNSIRKMKNVVNMINCSNIDIVGTFVLGAPGESEKTLKETLDFAQSSQFESCGASILSPLPGSGIFYELLNRHPELDNSDFVDLSKLQQRYIEDYCSVSFHLLSDAREKIASLSKEPMDLY